MLNVGIVGGTGYTGVELLRLLARHPHARSSVITSRGEAGRRVDEFFPNLRGHLDLRFCEPDPERLAACDVVFFATPNGTAMQAVPALLEAGVRIVDLGADFRIRDLELWSQWYGMEHACPEIAAEAVYGLPERHRAEIRQARLVANPGCYPTSVQLGFLPLVEQGLVDLDTLIADAKSGASGAGRQPKQHTLLGEASENFRAYGASGHRHLPEIRQGLTEAAGRPVGLTFTPHLVPMVRGIHATLYGRLLDTGVDLQAVYEARFADEPFVDVLPPGSHPETRTVRGINTCRIAVHRQPYSDMALVLAVEDNLVKGAAGQAVQNMNLMFGLDETAGLNDVALLP
ncbi:N-acetyl-gamma-glutamyl-phosphate reductase [Arhodomonas sp. AD133]|uniref:N-acetyl-gamma-glutamyl-phosphate reductase n=1 Tax=Arhodomonas sp. AD133 TaxID=3415009 RepID=UPI003EC147ED